MQTGTKKTPDRFQNYFCPAAANDIVHHAYAWIVKEPNMQPKFLYCRAIDEAIQIRDNACENIWESGGQSDLDEIVWDQIGAEYKSIKSDSHRGLSDVKDAKAKQAVHVNDDRENDAVALNVQEK